VGGFFRSLQFTAVGGLAYAEIEQDTLSRASTTASMAQQLMQSVGIGLSASVLHFLQVRRGEADITWQTVGPVFVLVGLVSLLSLVWFARLPREAGDELNGRRKAAALA
jgi:hypothetical protein